MFLKSWRNKFAFKNKRIYNWEYDAVILFLKAEQAPTSINFQSSVDYTDIRNGSGHSTYMQSRLNFKYLFWLQNSAC